MAPTDISQLSKKNAYSKLAVENHQSLDVSPRKVSFPFTAIKNKYFFNGNSIKTCFLAGLSSTFPPGESEFIESVRNYRDKIDNPNLAKQVLVLGS